MRTVEKRDVISSLQRDILRLEGFKTWPQHNLDFGLGPIIRSFPQGSFPLGAVHEFLSHDLEDIAPTAGFIAGLIASIMGSGGTSLWIGSSPKVFPPALKNFGIDADRFIFVDLKKQKDVLWTIEEALKCSALSAVIGETRELSFNDSRRLQLAVEQSKVTAFILRSNVQSVNPTACVSRWKISSLPSQLHDNLPGVGFPTWKVELLKIRNGKPGVWNILWADGKFSVNEWSAYRAELNPGIKQTG